MMCIKTETSRQSGFTLLELLIVIAIIGVLAGIGYPAYTSAIAKASRSDAIDALLRQQGQMEEFYLNNDTYVGAPLLSATSDEGYYNIAIASATAFAYSITATRAASGDADCAVMAVNQLGQKTSSTSGGAATSDCW